MMVGCLYIIAPADGARSSTRCVVRVEPAKKHPSCATPRQMLFLVVRRGNDALQADMEIPGRQQMLSGN